MSFELTKEMCPRIRSLTDISKLDHTIEYIFLSQDTNSPFNLIYTVTFLYGRYVIYDKNETLKYYKYVNNINNNINSVNHAIHYYIKCLPL